MKYIWASLTLSLTFFLMWSFVPECLERSLSETAAAQTNFIVEVDGAGQIRMNGQKIGLLDDAGLLGIRLQRAVKLHPGRALVQLRFVGDATWEDLIGLVYIIEGSGVDEIQIQDTEGENNPLVTLRKRNNPAKIDRELAVLKPNPLTLVVGINADGDLSLNSEYVGKVSDAAALIRRLESIFKGRESNRAYKPGMETRSDIPMDKRIEKTVWVKASRSQTVGHVLKLIALLKSAGAKPIGVQLDDLPL